MDLSGLAEFLTSATAPWWSGLAGIVIGAIGTNISNKRRDDRHFSEARTARDAQVALENSRRAEDREHAERDARKSDVRNHISSLLQTTGEILEQATAKILSNGHDDAGIRAHAMAKLPSSYYHVSQIKLRCDGGIVDIAAALHNRAADVALFDDEPTKLVDLANEMKDLQHLLVRTVKIDPEFSGLPLDEIEAIDLADE